MWQELFNPNSELRYSTENSTEDFTVMRKVLPHTFTIESLTKLLMYGNHVKAKAEAQSTPISEIVVKELERYPYKRKSNSVDPYFTPTDLKGSYQDVNFRAGITDAGMRMAVNDSIMFLPKNFYHYLDVYTAEGVSVI